MAKSQIDIENLSPNDDDSGEQKRLRAPSKSKSKPTPTADKQLRDRLVSTFDRISAVLEARGDSELASIIDEEAEVMAQGLVAATKPFRIFRVVVVGFVSLVEPSLAFGRVFRVLFGRLLDWRSERQVAYAQQQEQTDGEYVAA